VLLRDGKGGDQTDRLRDVDGESEDAACTALQYTL
jgi:hypothetical protein